MLLTIENRCVNIIVDEIRKEISMNDDIRDQVESLISDLTALKSTLDSNSDDSMKTLDILLTAQNVANIAPEFRKNAYRYASERIEKSEKIGDYTVTKVSYKPSPKIDESVLAEIRVDHPELFDQICQKAEKLSDAERVELEERNTEIMHEAEEINDRLHRDQLYYHPELKEEFQSGTGGEKLSALLKSVGGYEDVINSWVARSSIFRLVKSKRD